MYLGVGETGGWHGFDYPWVVEEARRYGFFVGGVSTPVSNVSSFIRDSQLGPIMGPILASIMKVKSAVKTALQTKSLKIQKRVPSRFSPQLSLIITRSIVLA